MRASDTSSAGRDADLEVGEEIAHLGPVEERRARRATSYGIDASRSASSIGRDWAFSR